MNIKTKQRLGGLLIFILCGLGTIWNWNNLINKGSFYPILSLSAPMFAVVGIGLILFGSYREERIERGEDISKLSGLKLLTFRWWIILIIAIICGITNFTVIHFYAFPIR